MATNQFENSRISEGTLLYGAQHNRNVLDESNAVSRDDVRDGFAEPQSGPAARPESMSDTQGPRSFLPASKVLGSQVHNPAGDELGSIEELLFDPGTGSIVYAVLSSGGFLGIGDKRFPVPWRVLRIDSRGTEFILDTDHANLEKAPGFDMSNRPGMADPAYQREVHEYYSGPHWEHSVTDAPGFSGTEITPDRSSEYDVTSGYRKDPKH